MAAKGEGNAKTHASGQDQTYALIFYVSIDFMDFQ